MQVRPGDKLITIIPGGRAEADHRAPGATGFGPWPALSPTGGGVALPERGLSATWADLAANAGRADGEPVWPADSWEALRRGGVLGWSVPAEYGGRARTRVELFEGYEALAGACLTTCFILSQREAACRRIADGDNEALKAELLPSLARGEQFATVGLSQLTTSRQ